MNHEDATTPAQLVVCPEPRCRAPATVVDRFWLPSTDGPVAHVKTWCESKHWFTPRVESVTSWPVRQTHQPPPEAAA
jgi:hypothetical protein